jgi:hypothetical protein
MSSSRVDSNGRPTVENCIVAKISAPHGPFDAGVLLGGLADVERDLIRTRTAEGPPRRANEEDPKTGPSFKTKLSYSLKP